MSSQNTTGESPILIVFVKEFLDSTLCFRYLKIPSKCATIKRFSNGAFCNRIMNKRNLLDKSVWIYRCHLLCKICHWKDLLCDIFGGTPNSSISVKVWPNAFKLSPNCIIESPDFHIFSELIIDIKVIKKVA